MANENVGDSAQPLTVHSAAQRLELLSEPEEKQGEPAEPETATEEETPAPEATDDVEEVADPTSEEVESDEGDDEPTPELQEPPKHKVKANGQDLEVTLDELKKGYSRTEDYTRKTQQHSENVRTFEAEKHATLAARQNLHDGLSQVHETLTALTQEPDWDTLRREDPAQFAQTHAAWQLHKERLDAIAAKRDQTAQELAVEAQKGFQAHLQAEHTKLVAALPELGDPTTGQQARQDLRAYALKQGFTPAQLSEAADHRVFVLLHKAMLFDKAQTDKVTATKEAQKKIDKVKVVAPGPSPSTRPKVSELTRRKQRLAQTNSVHDAAHILELMDDA